MASHSGCGRRQWKASTRHIAADPLERFDPLLDHHPWRDLDIPVLRDLPEGPAGGGSDGNFTAALGVPTLDGLGPQGDGAHALHEHVLLTDLSFRGALLAATLTRLAEGGNA